MQIQLANIDIGKNLNNGHQEDQIFKIFSLKTCSICIERLQSPL